MLSLCPQIQQLDNLIIHSFGSPAVDSNKKDNADVYNK